MIFCNLYLHFCVFRSMKIIYSLLAITLLTIGCHSSNTTAIPLQCSFSKKLLPRDSALQGKFPADSARAYTYNTYTVNFDSLLQSLCSNGFLITEAWNSAPNSYLCMDALGPRPVLVLTVSDSTLLKYGFTSGNSGRLGCSTSLYYYKPD